MSRHHVKLNAARWQRLRRMALDRDGWRCVKCGRSGRLEVDHVVALHLGGAAWELANLQSLCRKHHFQKTSLENGGDGELAPGPGLEQRDWIWYTSRLELPHVGTEGTQ